MDVGNLTTVRLTKINFENNQSSIDCTSYLFNRENLFNSEMKF